MLSREDRYNELVVSMNVWSVFSIVLLYVQEHIHTYV